MNCSRCPSTDAKIHYGNYPLCDDCYNKSEQLWNDSQDESAIQKRIESVTITHLPASISMNDTLLEHHSVFFNKAKFLVKDMTDDELNEHIKKLELLVVEVKANYSAADGERRERRAKLSADGKSWLVTSDSPNLDASDALSTVKSRRDRMTKADKQLEQFIGMGMDRETAEGLVANMFKAATEKQVKNPTFNAIKKEPVSSTKSGLCEVDKHSDCIGRYSNDKGSHECKCECHSGPKEPEKAIDFDNLFG